MRAWREHYIIDGYNLINYWPEIAALQSNLSVARDKLNHILTEYSAYERFRLTIVYDALSTPDEEHREKLNDHAEVIYTGAGETADSRIERLAYESVRRGGEVYVVTSDGAEQTVVLGAGACRIPSREFRKTVLKTKKRLREKYLGEVRLPVVRNELRGQLDSATAALLDEMRKSR